MFTAIQALCLLFCCRFAVSGEIIMPQVEHSDLDQHAINEHPPPIHHPHAYMEGHRGGRDPHESIGQVMSLNGLETANGPIATNATYSPNNVIIAPDSIPSLSQLRGTNYTDGPILPTHIAQGERSEAFSHVSLAEAPEPPQISRDATTVPHILPSSSASPTGRGIPHQPQGEESPMDDATVVAGVASAGVGIAVAAAAAGVSYSTNQNRKRERNEVDMEAENYIQEWSSKNAELPDDSFATPMPTRWIVKKPSPAEFEPIDVSNEENRQDVETSRFGDRPRRKKHKKSSVAKDDLPPPEASHFQVGTHDDLWLNE